VKNGGKYGISYRAYLLVGIENLFVTVMMITSDQVAFSSILNTVSFMGMEQATKTAADLCAQRNCLTSDLPYKVLRAALERGGVFILRYEMVTKG
jgi:hypothetical protein